MKYTDQDLREEMQRVHEKLGHPPTTSELNEHGNIRSNTYYRRVGDSWDDILSHFGYDPNNSGSKVFDEQALLDEIKNVATKIGRQPTGEEFREHGQYPIDRYYSVFDGWVDAIKKAGYDAAIRPNHGIDIQELIDDIRRVADDIGRSPSSAEYSEKSKYSLDAVYTRFDSWDDALEAADLEVLNFKKVTQITDKQELVDALREDIQRLGHVPNRNELNKKGTYTDTTYRNHFGGYNTALKTAGFPVNQRNNTLKEIECFGCGSTIQKPEWKIEDRDNLFCSKDCLYQATIDTSCNHCDAETEAYYVTHWKSDKRAFCDYSCRSEYYRVSDHHTIQKNCTNCGIPFQLPVHKKDQQNVFCTKECGYEFRRLSEEELIEDLQKAYERLPDETALVEIAAETGHYSGPYYRVFDSLHDAAEAAGLDIPYGRTTVECENCTNLFETRKKRARNDRRCFCNRECYLNWMRQGHLREDDERRVPDYGPSWESQRQAARERDNFTCQSCGMTKEEHLEQYKVRPHVHHISPWHQFDDHEERNRLQNLIVLCVDCHAKWEKMPVEPQIPSQ
jgi:5-methylcytosine-specific restriction endonuclease McrA